MASRYSVRIHDTSSGDYLETVDVADGTWKTSILSPGSGTHTIPLGDRTFTRAEIRFLTQPWARTVVHCWDGVPLYAGLIMRRKYDVTKASLALNHGELRNIFSRRLPFAVGDPATPDVFDPTGKLTVISRSFRAAVRAVVMSASTSPGFELPIVFPADGAGPYSNTWQYWSFKTVEEMLAEIEKTAGGPEIHFRPQLAGSSLSYTLRVGDPRLTGPVYEWTANGPAADAVGTQVLEDASRQLTGVFGVGDGSEKLITVGGARNAPGPAIPFMDQYRSFKGTSDKAKLNAFSNAQLTTLRTATLSTTFQALASQTDNLGALVPGSTLRLYFDDDYFVEDGWQENRMMGISGSTKDAISFEVQA